MYAKTIALMVVLSLCIPPEAIAKKGGGKNAQHGKGIEAVQHLYHRAKAAYSKPVASKKDRLKQATKLRNITKAIGRKARGVNHSQNPKG
jgi:hypothetical protein